MAVFVLAVALAAVAEARAQDKIHVKSSQVTIEGTVIGMTYKDIQYESVHAGGVQTTHASKDVREIEFDPGNKPYDYVSGEELFNKGEFAEAKDKFERSRRDTRNKDPFRQYARWYIIQCHLQMNQPDETVAACRALRQESPDSFFLKDSFLMQFDAARMKGNAALLEDTLKEFEKAAQEKAVDEWKKNVDLIRADVAEAKKDYKTARTAFDKFARDPDPDIALSAKMGILRCMAGAADWAGLKGRAETIINELKAKKDAPAKLLLSAYLALAKAQLFGDKNNKEALLNFMRCVLDIAPKTGEASREHEEAIAHAAIASARYAAEQKEKDKKDLYRERAWQLRTELERKYPGCAFLKDIEKEIAAIPK